MLGRHRDEVFIAGGQPTVTYVEREGTNVEREFARAVATPNQVVSLSGSTKTGKTVLCRRVLGERQYVWVDGGVVKDAPDFWDRVAYELNIPYEQETLEEGQAELKLEGSVPLITTASGSKLSKQSSTDKFRVNSMASALSHMAKNKVMLVIDDFHYLSDVTRTELMRNIKGAVFNGLKVILLSVTHRVFDAIRAESELTGRFTAISLPNWSTVELLQIPQKGFDVLATDCPDSIIDRLRDEAQSNPMLMQKFCWEICFDCGIEHRKLIGKHVVPVDYPLDEMFKRIAQDAGLPIYQKLAAGPQSRKARAKRPLKTGGEADIYQALLLAIAESGPKAIVPYDELRSLMNSLLAEQMPQKHEISSALKHLSRISREIGAESAIDWDEDNREVNVVDPYLRFYLRWQVRKGHSAAALIAPEAKDDNQSLTAP